MATREHARLRTPAIARVVPLCLLLALAVPTLAEVDWPLYAGDEGSSKFSPADRIDIDNLDRLGIAWVWKTPDGAIIERLKQHEQRAFIDNFKGTPLKIGNRLYIRTGLGIVAALDAATGEPVWIHDDERYESGMPFSYGFTTRGLARWRDDRDRLRLIATTPDRHLVALDAETGKPVTTFGEDGYVALDDSIRRQAPNPRYMNYSNQVPVIVGDVIVLGSVVTDAELAYLTDKGRSFQIPVGDIRGFDARTGKHLWTFHTIPGAGEPGVETWGDESWRWVGSTNVWSLASADPELGLVYLPVTAPTFNYYGGFRPGDNLYGQSIVALDARTGERRWHYQTIHHPIWDYDLPAAPVLFDLEIDGRLVRGLAQVGKNGFVYVLDRVTGEPVWPIPERPVPEGDTPGETYSKTQPHPVKPPPFALQGFFDDSVNAITPEIRREVLEMIAPYDRGVLYTPVSTRGTIISPGIGGGANWPGAALDPATGRLYVSAINNPTIRGLMPADNAYGYRMRRFSGRIEGGLPIVKPPWGTITAYDLQKGTMLWQVPNAEGPRNHPDFSDLDLPWLGVSSKTNLLVTPTLLFAATSGAGSFEPEVPISALRLGNITRERAAEIPLNTRARLRILDKRTGEHLWQHPIGPSFGDGGGLMTYIHKGRQFVVVPTGGGQNPSYLVAFALIRED